MRYGILSTENENICILILYRENFEVVQLVLQDRHFQEIKRKSKLYTTFENKKTNLLCIPKISIFYFKIYNDLHSVFFSQNDGSSIII